MPIQFNCQYCDKFLKVKDEYIGRKIKCPGCSYKIDVPSVSSKKQYLIKSGEDTIGPIKFIEVAELVSKGNFKGSDLISVLGTDKFRQIRELSEFQELTKMASQKAVIVSSKKVMGLMLKVGIIVAAIIFFFGGKAWWTNHKIEAREIEIQEILNNDNLKLIPEAREKFKILENEYPGNKRVEEIKDMIDEVEKAMIEHEMKNFSAAIEEIQALMDEAKGHISEDRFLKAVKTVKKTRKKIRNARKISVVKKKSQELRLKELEGELTLLVEDMRLKRKEYVLDKLDEANTYQLTGDLKEARKILKELESVSEFDKGLSYKVKKKLKEANKLSKMRPGARPKTDLSRKDLSTDVIEGIQSDDDKKRLKALKVLILTRRKLSNEDTENVKSTLLGYLERKKMLFPAIDAILYLEDKGESFEKMFSAFLDMVIYGGGTKDFERPVRKDEVFIPKLVAYIDQYGEFDKGEFFGGLLIDDKFAKYALREFSKYVTAEDVPNVKNRIEKIVLESKDDNLVAAAIEALGKLKSEESLDLLKKIIDYSGCQRCRYGKGKSGSKYMFQDLFCARCRGGIGFRKRGSLFLTTLGAIKDIGNRRVVKLLKKLKEKAEIDGHRDLIKEIGSIIEDIEKR